ncbi:VWA domain-containing protein [Candidatus Woesearchaeota archaeon]|nr:VWA domain-containing protein [Candidatus Woesearchaeota archaeon]
MIQLIDIAYRYFEEPYFLLFIIPVIILLWYFIDKDFLKLPLDDNQKKRLSNKRIFIFITRSLIFVLLLIALATPFIEKTKTIQGDPRLRLLIDNSSSMGVFDYNEINNLKKELESRIPVELGYVSEGEKSALGENLLANLKKNENVLLISDGYSNSGIDLGDTVLRANSFNTSISAVNLKIKNYDASVAVYGSEKTTAEVDNTFVVKITQTNKRNVHVIVDIDGSNIIDTTTDSNEITFTKKFDNGYHKITAKLDAEDYFKQNNIFHKTVKVVPKPKILIYSGSGIEINKLFEPIYSTVLTNQLPEDLSQYYAVVVDNADIKNIDSKVNSLTDFITDGNGMFVIGGTNSFDSGGYKNSRFEQILPVFVSKVGRKKGENNIVVVMDISGSTGHTFGDSVKVDVEKAIALDMIKNLSLINSVGLVAFNTQAYRVFDIKKLIDQPDMKETIMSLRYTGGTFISNGLLMGIEMLRNKPGSKNIILISDGVNQDEKEALEVARLASTEGIKIYTVGVGDDTNAQNLLALAELTGGTYFEPDSADRVRILFGDPEISGDKKVFPLIVFDNKHFITQGLKLKGNLYGFNQVVPKTSSKLLITTDVGDPILTVSRLGLGRVAALSTDYSLYGFELLNKDNSLLMTRATNWVIGDPERKNDKFVDIKDGRTGEPIEIKVKSEIQPSSGQIALYKVDDGLYTGSLIVNEVGFKQVLDGTFSVNYKEEYEGVGIDPGLDRFTASTGGKMFNGDAINEIVEFIHIKSKRDIVKKNSYSWIFALAALTIYLIEVGFRRSVRNKK